MIVFKIFAILITIGGATGSMMYLLNAIQKYDSMLLITLYVAWVLSPFLGLLVAESFSKGRSGTTQVKLYLAMILTTAVSLLVYSGEIPVKSPRPDFPFLVIPVFCWLCIGLGALLFRRRSRRRRRA